MKLVYQLWGGFGFIDYYDIKIFLYIIFDDLLIWLLYEIKNLYFGQMFDLFCVI